MTYSASDWDALAVRVQAGDREAFRVVVVELHEEVRASVSRIVRNAEQADEAVQAAFVRAYQRIGTYRGGGTFRPWLKAIARNQAHDLVAEDLRFVRSEGLMLDVLAIEAIEPEEPPVAARRLADCLAQMSARHRLLVERHHGEGISLNALARQFRIAATTLAVQLFRLRRSLRRCIEQPPERT